jgi:dihydroorotase
MDYLVHQAGLELTTAVAAWTSGPAAVLGLDRGTLSPGKPADITIIDLEIVKEVDTEAFESKGRNNPYRGVKLKGWPEATLVNGKLVAKGGRIL